MAGIGVILVLQYSRRRTKLSRLLAGVLLVLLISGVPLPYSAAFALQSRLGRKPAHDYSLHAGIDAERAWATRAYIETDGRVRLAIPLAVAGVPKTLAPVPDRAEMTIEAPNGTRSRLSGRIAQEGRFLTLEGFVPARFYRDVKHSPLKMRGTFFVTLYGDPQSVRLPYGTQRILVRGLGLCSAAAGQGELRQVFCTSPSWPGATLTWVSYELAITPDARMPNLDAGRFSYARAPSYAPFSTELVVNPVHRDTADPLTMPLGGTSEARSRTAAVVTTLEPVAHVAAPLAIDGLVLGPHEVQMK